MKTQLVATPVYCQQVYSENQLFMTTYFSNEMAHHKNRYICSQHDPSHMICLYSVAG